MIIPFEKNVLSILKLRGRLLITKGSFDDFLILAPRPPREIRLFFLIYKNSY